MKEQVQENGVRKWFGDDYIELQAELAAAIRAHYEDHGNMILSGCGVTDNGNGTYNLSAGVAVLKNSLGASLKLCRVYAQANIPAASFPIYLVQAQRDKTEVPAYGREYKDATTKNIIVEYYGKVETSLPAHGQYVSIASNGTAVRYRDAIQGAAYRFVTDAEKAGWNAKLDTSGYTAADVLAKLKTVDTDNSGLNANTLQGYTAEQLIALLGTGSVVDADTLDGYHASAFLLAAAYTAADVLSKLKTVDGSGSGLDADTLDGNEAAAFLLATAYTAADVLNKLKTVDGVSSGLDADLLDGNHASAFMLATAAANFATAAQGTKADNALPAADATSSNTANKAVKRDSSGYIYVSDVIIS